MQSFFAYLAGKAIFRHRVRTNRRGILDAMNREHGYTLMETLVTLTLMMILSVGGLYGWQRWQQQQRLWQTAVQVRDFLLFLRYDRKRTALRRCQRREKEKLRCGKKN